VVLVTATVWVARYDPLERGSFGGGPPAGLDAEILDVSLAGAEVERVFRIPARPGMTFTYSFSVANRGPVAVGIEGIGTPRAEQAGDVVTRYPVRMKVNIVPGPVDVQWVPFHSFTLIPGQEAQIEMRATLHECIDGSLSWGSEDVRFTVFGFERHEMFTPDVLIQLVGASPHCPT
jgi:hypothetical protein